MVVLLAVTVATSSRAMVRRVVVAEDLDGAIVGFERVVEGELVFGKAERLAARVGVAHILGKRDELLNDLAQSRWRDSDTCEWPARASSAKSAPG